MNQNMLKLNPDKTKFMVIGNIAHRKTVSNKYLVELLSQKIANIACMRNAGVAFDSGFFSHNCESAFYHIHGYL